MRLERDLCLEASRDQLLRLLVAQHRDLEMSADGHHPLHERVLLGERRLRRILSPDCDSVATQRVSNMTFVLQ